MSLKILFFGDLMGKISRHALKQALPVMKKKYKPDLIVANGENAAHGTGITRKIFDELLECGVEFITLGDHAFDKDDAKTLVKEFPQRIIQPANLVRPDSASGTSVIEVKGKKVLMINLLGRVFMKTDATDPFKKADEILKSFAKQKFAAIIIDFHAEATSEKVAFGWYMDGRVSAVVGTHTHVPTADERVLPQGTAYVSDIGMVGAEESVIGVNKETIIRMFLEDAKYPKEPIETGRCRLNCVLIEIDEKTGLAKNVKRVDTFSTV